MNYKASEVGATRQDGSHEGSSSPEEPGGKKARNCSRNNIPALLNENERCLAFRQQFFPSTGIESWNDWNWQIRNSVTSDEQISRIIPLTSDEKIALTKLRGRLPMRITPYYLSLFASGDEKNPIRKMMIPRMDELQIFPEEKPDSLNEHGFTPLPGLVHRYPDRVLFLVTQFCSAYCRYCTRSHSVGKLLQASHAQWEQALRYISSHTEIRDVLISGGDPLTLSDQKLEFLLSELHKIKHVDIVRIGTKVPVVLPQRITPQLVGMLRKYHPLWMSIHFSHPDEITTETSAACARLADAGIPLGSQTVLLREINDDPDVMRSLMQKLLKIRVRPYYLYQCDLVPGSRHFRTPVSKGLEIIKNLRGFTSGYAVPHFVIDAPGGGGKVPLLPDYDGSTSEQGIKLRNYLGETFYYPEF